MPWTRINALFLPDTTARHCFPRPIPILPTGRSPYAPRKRRIRRDHIVWPGKAGDQAMQGNESRPGRSEPTKMGTFQPPDWVALLPASVVAVGAAEQPVERLLTLQSAIARAVHIVTAVGRLRLRLPLYGVFRIRSQ